MIRRIFWPLLFVTCVCAAWSALRTGVHDFSENQCGDCHTSTPVKGEPRSRVMKAPVSALCGRCHPRPADALSHPVEMKPVNVAVPADFPLSWEGKLTCSTCHDIHAPAPPAWEGAWRYLRRPEGGRALCEACHRLGVDESGKPSSHAESLSQAHMVYDLNESGRIDKMSAVCLGCHDGSQGKSVEVKVPGTFQHGMRQVGSANELSHPIGISYRKAMRQRGGLRRLESLDPRIKLVKGRVSCVSCHDIYSGEHMHLTVSNRGSALCLACHDK